MACREELNNPICYLIAIIYSQTFNCSLREKKVKGDTGGSSTYFPIIMRNNVCVYR